MGERLFKALLRLYPASFRQRYEGELLDFFRSDRAAAASRDGGSNPMRFWGRTLADLLKAASRQRLRRRGRRHTGANVPDPLPPGRGPERAGWSDGLLLDLRFALRSLMRQPGFTIVAVGILGLGIGASTTLFSAVDGVLLRPLPYPDHEELVFLGSRLPQGTRISHMSLPEFMDVMNEVGSVEAYAAARGRALDLVGEGEPERVAVLEVSSDYFQVLGATPALGRTFTQDEHLVSEARVVVVSHGLWIRLWGRDPDIVGKTFRASDGNSPELQTYTVVGVFPPGFANPTSLEDPYSRLPPGEIWAPLPVNAEAYATSRTNYTIRTVARLRPGSTLEGLNSELDALALSLVEAHPFAHVRGDTYRGLAARPLLDEVVGTRRRDLLILLGATGLVLLIACANVAGLLLARALDRTRELGLRSALGAGRRRLFRQLVTESLALGLLGGGLGVGLAVLGVHAFRYFGPADFPRMADVALNLRILGFGVGVALVTGLVLGIGPALTGSSDKDGSILAPGTRGSTSGARTLRLRGSLVALEVALALVLLTGCGLLTRSLVRLQGMDPGIDTEKLAIMQVRLPPSYDLDEERRAFFSRLQDRLEGLPGVVSASHVTDPPMAFNNWSPNLWREEDLLTEEPAGLGNAHPVGGDYFRTMGIPILRGRGFTEDDGEAAPPVTVVSRTLAEVLWLGEDPLGKRLGISIRRDGPWVTVVGVAGDIRQRSLASEPARDLYFPYAQASGDHGLFMAVRTAGDPMALADAFREAVWYLDDDVPVPEITTMEARVDATLRLPRFRTLLLAAFAGVALLLSGAGIYGTLMYTVGRRTPEVGIRMALGAEARDVVGLVLRQGLWPVAVGLAVGLGGAFAATRLLESVLFQVSPFDPPTFALTATVLLGVSLLACYLPARRATRVDPMTALRED